MNEYKEATYKVSKWYHPCDYGGRNNECKVWIKLESLFGIGEFAYCKTHARQILLHYVDKFKKHYGEYLVIIKSENDENE